MRDQRFTLFWQGYDTKQMHGKWQNDLLRDRRACSRTISQGRLVERHMEESVKEGRSCYCSLGSFANMAIEQRKHLFQPYTYSCNSLGLFFFIIFLIFFTMISSLYNVLISLFFMYHFFLGKSYMTCVLLSLSSTHLFCLFCWSAFCSAVHCLGTSFVATR